MKAFFFFPDMRAIWDYKTGSSLQLLIFSCKATLANTRVHCTCRLISSPFTDIWHAAQIACIYVKPHVVRGSRTLDVLRDAQWDRWNARFAWCSEKKKSHAHGRRAQLLLRAVTGSSLRFYCGGCYSLSVLYQLFSIHFSMYFCGL